MNEEELETIQNQFDREEDKLKESYLRLRKITRRGRFSKYMVNLLAKGTFSRVKRKRRKGRQK